MNRPIKLFPRISLVVFFLLLHSFLPASDHIDGPVTTSHAVADITGLFAFPSPDHPGHLVLIMNVYPGVASDGHFSDKVNYNFFVRNARIRGTRFQTTGDYQISCTFETPHGNSSPHWVTCKSSTGASIRVEVGKLGSLETDSPIHAFAGRLSDPFFFNAGWAVSASKGKLDPPKDLNVMQDLNALSIVLLIDVEKEIGLDLGSLFAIAGTTATSDDNEIRQIDRIGRPEITNITMSNNGRQEVRDLFNAQRPFDLEGKNVELFRQRLRQNVVFYDKLNGKSDWTPESGNNLAEILLNDYLVVDVSKPFSKDTYFDIEYSILKGGAYTTCGGRVPNDDIIDIIFTMLINGGNKPMVKDGVDKPTKWATEVFPYLAAPTDGFFASVKSFLARYAVKLGGSKKQFWIGILGILSGLFLVIGSILILYYLIRMAIARLGSKEYSKEKHARLMFSIGAAFGLTAIFSLITNSFSHFWTSIFAILATIAFTKFFRNRK